MPQELGENSLKRIREGPSLGLHVCFRTVPGTETRKGTSVLAAPGGDPGAPGVSPGGGGCPKCGISRVYHLPHSSRTVPQP